MVDDKGLFLEEPTHALQYHGPNNVRGLQVAKELESDSKLIVTIFTSGVERYLSTPLFEPSK